VLFRPLHCLGNADAPILIPNLTCPYGRLAQGHALGFAQLRLPQNQEILSAQVFLLSGAVGLGQSRAQGLDVCAAKLRFFGEQLRQPFVDLSVSLRETLAQFFRDAINLEVTPRLVANPVAERL
jgi:hypothetical protein